MVFSDYIHKYKVDLQKMRVILLITDNNLYTLQVNDYKVINCFPLNDLFNILTIVSNSSVFALNFKTSKALMLETIRRTEVLIYLINNADNDPLRDNPVINKSYKLRLIS
jgi:hypothetical protein